MDIKQTIEQFSNVFSGQNLKRLHIAMISATPDAWILDPIAKILVSTEAKVWYPKDNLLPGQDWRLEHHKVYEDADIVLVFITRNFLKTGDHQKFLKVVQDVKDGKPEGASYIVPILLEDCQVPESLRGYRHPSLDMDQDIPNIVNLWKKEVARRNDLHDWPNRTEDLDYNSRWNIKKKKK